MRFWLIIPALVLSSVYALGQQLKVFTPNSPAIASEVNANFALLKGWIESKVGSVTSAGISTPSLTVGSSGAVTLTSNGSGQLTASGGLALADGTGLTSNRFGVSIPVSQAGLAMPFTNNALEGTFTDNGGTIMIMASATGFCTTAGRITMNVLVDGNVQGRMRLQCQQINTHVAFPATFVRMNRLNLSAFPATRTVRLEPINCSSGCNAGLVTTNVDSNDFGEVTVLRLPTP